ncbi:unnamed protein product [marine sediment metagenome]|uniref:Uncharacterized protein n=1 Tax=marine sediment metagenome TaxID=412755 RepID=X1F7D9_9ZZZZ
MGVQLVFKSHVQNNVHFFTGEAVFIDGEEKDADFDTKDDLINLSIFSYGELRILVEGKDEAPVLNVAFGSIDHETGKFHEEGAFSELTENGTDMLKVANLTGRMAIDATLAGGTFKVTITGEFKK